MSERSSCRCVPSPQSTSTRSPPRRRSVAAVPRTAVGADAEVPRKTRSRSTGDDRNPLRRPDPDAADPLGHYLPSGRDDEHLAGHDRGRREPVALAELPHAFPRIAREAVDRDRPERVAGLDAVALLGPARAGFAGEQRPQHEDGERDERDASDQADGEHVFDDDRTCVRCQEPEQPAERASYRSCRTTVVVRAEFVSATRRTASVTAPPRRGSATVVRRFCATLAVAHATPIARAAITRRALESVCAPGSRQTRADAASAAVRSIATTSPLTRVTGRAAPCTARTGRHAAGAPRHLPSAIAAATSPAAGRMEPSAR